MIDLFLPVRFHQSLGVCASRIMEQLCNSRLNATLERQHSLDSSPFLTLLAHLPSQARMHCVCWSLSSGESACVSALSYFLSVHERPNPHTHSCSIYNRVYKCSIQSSTTSRMSLVTGIRGPDVSISRLHTQNLLRNRLSQKGKRSHQV